MTTPVPNITDWLTSAPEGCSRGYECVYYAPTSGCIGVSEWHVFFVENAWAAEEIIRSIRGSGYGDTFEEAQQEAWDAFRKDAKKQAEEPDQ